MTVKPCLRRVLFDRAEVEQRLQENRAVQCRLWFRVFFRHAFANALEPGTRLDWGWHLDAICDHLQWVFEEWRFKKENPDHEMAVQNLLINIPPRCLKSKIVSIAFCAWCWLHDPDMTFIGLGVPSVALDNARDCLRLVRSGWYRSWFRPSWTVAEDQAAATDFAIVEYFAPDDAEQRHPLPERVKGGTERVRGWRKARGWLATITGTGADCLLPDDPHDAEQVHSDEMRERVLSKWDKAIWNRVRDQRSSIRIGVMQRLREDDWAGHVLAKALEDPAQPQWVHLRIALQYRAQKRCETAMPVGPDNLYIPRAVRKPDDVASKPIKWGDPRTADGEIMDPVRFPPRVVAAELLRFGPYGFSGQYNQDPEPIGGGIFKRRYWNFFRFEDVEVGGFARPEGCRSVAECPPLVVKKKKHRSSEWDFDWVSISMDAAFRKAKDEKRGHRSNVGLGVAAGKGARRFILTDWTRPASFGESKALLREISAAFPYAWAKLIEGKANGDAIADELVSEIPGIVLIDPGQDSKEGRAFSQEPILASGEVYLLEGAHWLDPYVSEWAGFPLMKRNDRVDWTVQVLLHHGAGSASAAFLQAAQMKEFLEGLGRT